MFCHDLGGKMASEFKSVRVLRFGNTDDYKDFEEGNIVHIDTNEGMFGVSYKGKITWIDTEWIEVDCSTLYHNDLRKFNFKDILYIERIENK
jgi:hypothetical protein